MRICFIIEAWKPFYAGGQVHAIELCKRLVANHGCSVDIYTRALKVDGKTYSKNESLLNGKIKVIRKGIPSKLESVVGRLSWIMSFLGKPLYEKYDIVHGQANLGGLPGWIIGKLKKIPSIFTVHGSGLLVWNEMAKGVILRINCFVENFLQTKLKYNTEISVDSRFCKFKNKNKPIVIPNGVDVDKFDKIKVQKEKKYTKILFVGRLHPQKGLIYLIKSIESIKNKIKNTKFVIIGSGELDEKLQKEIKKRKLTKFFDFKGKVFGDDLVREFKSSHLFILPSIFEGQPLTLLEAWAAKLPVLVTNVGDNDRFVINNKNGWIIDPKNPKKLSNSILKILSKDKKDLNNIGNSGYKLVKENYSWDKMTEKTYKVYIKNIK